MDHEPPLGDGGEVTRLLQQWRRGDAGAEARLFELILPDLRRLAGRFMRHERPGHTLSPTALLNETYLRLAGAREHDWQNRRHFFAVAARSMRRYLIDYARARPRASFIPVDGDLAMPPAATALETALAVDAVLDELDREHPDHSAVVELKFFLGMTDQEAADALGVPLRTAQRRWHVARAWLFTRLQPSP